MPLRPPAPQVLETAGERADEDRRRRAPAAGVPGRAGGPSTGGPGAPGTPEGTAPGARPLGDRSARPLVPARTPFAGRASRRRSRAHGCASSPPGRPDVHRARPARRPAASPTSASPSARWVRGTRARTAVVCIGSGGNGMPPGPRKDPSDRLPSGPVGTASRAGSARRRRSACAPAWTSAVARGAASPSRAPPAARTDASRGRGSACVAPAVGACRGSGRVARGPCDRRPRPLRSIR